MGATRRQGGRGLRLRMATAAGAVAALALSGCFRIANTGPGGGWVPSADPSILKVGSYYYKYTTNAGYYRVPVERATNAKGPWSGLRDALDPDGLPSWAQRDFWAPGIWQSGSYYYLYFSARPSAGAAHSIGVARSTSPFGPFAYQTTLVAHSAGAIDPDVAAPAAGGLYLLYSIDHGGTVCGGNRRLMSQPLTSPTHMAADGPFTLLTARKTGWEHCTVENPSHARVGSYDFLFYSGGDFWYDSPNDYKIAFALCGNLRSACTRVNATGWPWGTALPFLERPGGEDVFWDGDKLRMAYHHGKAGSGHADERSLVVSDLVVDTSTYIGPG